MGQLIEKHLLTRSSDSFRRLNGSSGGVISELIIDHLRAFGYVIAPTFDSNTLKFKPTIITRENEYEQTGSVYHEMDMVGFVRSLVPENNIKWMVTCLPCEVKAIKSHFTKHNAEVMTLALACSGQLEYAATEKLFAMLGVQKRDVVKFRYRGGGWPGGVVIQLKNGKTVQCGNLESPWYDIFNSNIYTLKKCFYCVDVLGKHADVTAADPWLPDEIKNEKQGRTLLLDRCGAINEMESVCVDDILGEGVAEYSQRFTLSRKNAQKKHRKYVEAFWILRTGLIYFGNCKICLRIARIIYSKFWKKISKL